MFSALLKNTLVVCLLTAANLPAATPKLAKTYQDFLSGPTSYLITKAEKESFAALPSDQARDRFIERFWELRNPAPSAGENSFKEEFYRRLAHVNAFFGNDIGGDGWRSDRGRTYLLFGKPQTSMSYIFDQQLYPIELWFYSNPGLSEIPSFFYVMFFDRDTVGGYHFYHPYVDGPDKLVRSGPTKSQAFNYLNKNVSPELAHASLSLIPGEPIDTGGYSGSMDSARIVNAIQGYSQMPSYVAMISERARRLEHVTTAVTFDVSRSDLLAFVSYDKPEPWLHFQIEIADPLQPKASAGHAAFTVTSRLTSRGQLVYERTDQPAFNVPESDQDALKPRPFIFEDRLPVAAGQYRLTVSVTNAAARKTYDASRDILVESPSRDAALSDILITPRHEINSRDLPFVFGGAKFFPSADTQTTGGAGRTLGIYYQFTTSQRDAELPVEYVLGQVATKFRKTFEDKLDLHKANAAGVLLTAKELPLEGIAPGNYQLVVRITDPGTRKVTAKSTAVTIVPDSASSNPTKTPILISQGRLQTPEVQAATEYERALCWLAQGREPEAVSALENSWSLSHNRAIQPLLQHLREHQRLQTETNQPSKENSK